MLKTTQRPWAPQGRRTPIDSDGRLDRRVASPAQGVSYYERDGYYAKDDPEHRRSSAWAGKGAAELGLEGPVDPETFWAVLAGEVPDGTEKRLVRIAEDGSCVHQPGRDLTTVAVHSSQRYRTERFFLPGPGAKAAFPVRVSKGRYRCAEPLAAACRASANPRQVA